MSGEIKLGNINIHHIDISWLRQQISLVSQEPVLFNMSIEDNIRYGALLKNVTNEEIVDAAKIAKIHEFIISLPEVSMHWYNYNNLFVTIIIGIRDNSWFERSSIKWRSEAAYCNC